MFDGTNLITDRKNVFIKEAIRIAELMPDWDVIYQREAIVLEAVNVQTIVLLAM